MLHKMGNGNSMRSQQPLFRLTTITHAALQAPPLYVVTNLTTEDVQGSRRNGQGKRVDADGFTR